VSARPETVDQQVARLLRPRPAWLLDAAELLTEPDPGPTPWLVEDLIVDQAIVAAVGRWKTTKSYALLDICISVATGEPAFGELAIPEPGPVVFVNEESGRAALWRRLDSLCRGRAIAPDRLHERLFVAANARQRLDDEAAQRELLEIGERFEPRLFVFDPLARMKSPRREENAQTDMAVLIEFVRELRDQVGAAVCFVHHTGHAGDTMRGSSDLESAWESRLAWKREGQSPLVEIHAEHREAEAGSPIRYRVSWDHDTRTMRFPFVGEEGAPPLDHRILDWLSEHPNQKAEEVAKGVQVRVSDVRRTLETLENAGTTHNGPSGRQDAMGRPIRDKVWNLSSQAAQQLTMARPDDGTSQDDPPAEHRGSVARPVSLETDGTAEPPDDPHEADDGIPF
jgi:AAA domain